MRLGTNLLCLAAAALAALAAVCAAQDPVEFAKLKDFKAERSSSSSRDPNSNNDSKHPIGGETVTLAELEGPGVITQRMSGRSCPSTGTPMRRMSAWTTRSGGCG